MQTDHALPPRLRVVNATVYAPRASVVVAAYERTDRLRKLLVQLNAQSIAPEDFEVIVVDDGSKTPIDVSDVTTKFRLTVLRQANGGPAAARHRGAQEAAGEVLIIIDDDMQIAPDFVANHLRAHPAGSRRVRLGGIEPDPDVLHRGLFEQWNAERLRRVSKMGEAGARFDGNNMWSGNVSFRRADYFNVGGFDPNLRVSEDLELGLRLEKSGVEIGFAPGADAIHHSAHSNAVWFRRPSTCAGADKTVFRKHPESIHADPWRYYFMLPRLVRPFLDFEIAFPWAGQRVAKLLMHVGQLLMSIGQRRLALAVAAVVYAGEYFRGMRLEEGSRRACRVAINQYLLSVTTLPELPRGVPRRRAFWQRFRSDVATDHAMRAMREEKYGYSGAQGMGMASSIVQKIGVQLMFAIRVMTFFRNSGHGLLARITSRLIRHLYGSDVHWDAYWGPGTMIVHGFGLAISHDARIGAECVIFQNVCLGMGIDPVTRETGAPTLGRGVHVGPGASLLGPITVGDETKVMAGITLTFSVAQGSIVEAPVPVVRQRAPKDGAAVREQAI